MIVEFIGSKGNHIFCGNVHLVYKKGDIFFVRFEDGTLNTLLASEFKIVGVSK